MKIPIPVFLLAPLMVACSSPPGHSAKIPPVTDPVATAEAFIRMDTSGQGDLHGFDSLFTPCDGDRASDQLEPVITANARRLLAHGDTARFSVIYHSLGWVQSSDMHSKAQWVFRDSLHESIDTIEIVPAGGSLLIICGPYHGNHLGLSAMDSLLANFEPRSRLAWRQATGR